MSEPAANVVYRAILIGGGIALGAMVAVDLMARYGVLPLLLWALSAAVVWLNCDHTKSTTISFPAIGPTPHPVSQMFQSFEDLTRYRYDIRRPPGLGDRDEARLRLRVRSEEFHRVTGAVEEMKRYGWWEYFATRVLSDTYVRNGKHALYLLKQGAYIPRFDNRFDPCVFHALDTGPSNDLYRPLLDALLELGASVQDRDLEDRNLLEKRIDMLQEHSGAFVFSARTAPVPEDLRALWSLTGSISPRHLQTLRTYAASQNGTIRAQLEDLVRVIQSDQVHVHLDRETPLAVPQALPRRL